MKNLSVIIFLIIIFLTALFLTFNLAAVLLICFCISAIYYTLKLISFKKQNSLHKDKLKSILSLFDKDYSVVAIDNITNEQVFSNDRKLYKDICKSLYENRDFLAAQSIKKLSVDNISIFTSSQRPETQYKFFDDALIPVFVISDDDFIYVNKIARKMDIQNVDQEDVNLTKIFQSNGEEVFCVLPVCKNDLDVFVDSSPVPAIKINNKGRIISNNVLFENYANSKQKNIYDFLNSYHTKLIEKRIASVDEKGAAVIEIEMKVHEGVTKMCFILIMPVGKEFICQFVDITKYKNMETNFTHSQKMQAVGQLAGGIAHDFNNLLTAMLGYCDLLLMRHPVGDPSFADIMQIKQNAMRSSSLVRQLLAISRKEVFSPKKIDVNEAIDDLSHLITRLIEGKIRLRKNLGKNILPINIDQSQFDQVIINLIVNARDAVIAANKGFLGELSIMTDNFTFSGAESIESLIVNVFEKKEIAKGNYVLISIKDNGTGIKKSILNKIFEPYFSTKKSGEGTGLGLSTVYGIIKQSGGYLMVDTEIGKGTEFKILFPAYDKKDLTKESHIVTKKVKEIDLTGEETILIIEDEAPVRTFSAYALENKGYKVVQAESSEEAMQIIESGGYNLDLIISDVMMPGITGLDMAKKLREKHPELKVIFISGYGEEVLSLQTLQQKNISFLAKPFELKDLISKVREVLDEPRSH